MVAVENAMRIKSVAVLIGDAAGSIVRRCMVAP
jgi:hypothetical protein